jgi:hypothetical protein
VDGAIKYNFFEMPHCNHYVEVGTWVDKWAVVVELVASLLVFLAIGLTELQAFEDYGVATL